MQNNNFKRSLASLLILMCFMASSFTAKATHVAGADLTYKDLGNNNYEVTLTYYRDCAGSMPGNAENLRVSAASCGVDFNATLNVISGTGNEITFPCNSSASTCSGGSSFGVQKWSYSAVVNLPSVCADWVFSWNRCCRNCAITTTVHGNCQGEPESNFYLEAKLNNLNVAGNNSPTFTENPVATMCLGQNFVFNHGAIDVDGDSLAYNIVGSQIAPGTTVTYQNGYSAASPITSTPPLSVNSVTGDLSMTPQQLEVGVMAVRVDEYRGGVLIGAVTRDMQFIVQTCNNTLPTATGINGTAAFDSTICPGTQICFYVFTNDGDAGQHVTISANNTIPGAVFNNSGGSHPTGSFCWTPTAADARSTPWTFTVTVRDDACPTNGLQTYAFSINVPEIVASTVADNANGTIDLTVTGNTGPYTIQWSNGATTEDISGLTPGVYTATICESNGCCIIVEDSIVVPANCVFPVHVVRKQISCYGGCDGTITLTPNGGTGPYTYVWSNGNSTNQATNLCAGSYYYTVTDANGCTYSCHSVLTQPTPLNVNCSGSNTCTGACMGSASVIASGGKTPYTYLWSNGSTTDAINNLCCGIYIITVTDKNGCTNTCQYEVTQFQAITVTACVTNASCASACNGKMSAAASGGTAGYDFLWSNGSTASGVADDSIASLCPGNYSVTVTDLNGCSRKITRTVGPLTSRGAFGTNQSSETFSKLADEGAISFKAIAIPNPFSNDFAVETGNADAVEVKVFTVSGKLVKDYKNIYPGHRVGSDLSSGLYLIEMIQNGNSVFQRLAKQDQ
ncbi:MAG: T9SS type A sorting domain-containing protein [Bacteroidota bacterium]